MLLYHLVQDNKRAAAQAWKGDFKKKARFSFLAHYLVKSRFFLCCSYPRIFVTPSNTAFGQVHRCPPISRKVHRCPPNPLTLYSQSLNLRKSLILNTVEILHQQHEYYIAKLEGILMPILRMEGPTSSLVISTSNGHSPPSRLRRTRSVHRGTCESPRRNLGHDRVRARYEPTGHYSRRCLGHLERLFFLVCTPLVSLGRVYMLVFKGVL